MSAFSQLSMHAQDIISIALFIALIAQFILCLYQHLCREPAGRRLADAGLLCLLLLLLALLRSASEDGIYELSFPWVLIPAAAAAVLIYSAASVRGALLRNRQKLSPNAVRQALDDLNSGILFADRNGKIVLINNAMSRLAYTLTGTYPQSVYELQQALDSASGGSGIEKVGALPNIYRFPDGHVWRFVTVPLADPELSGFSQMTAQDVSALYEANTLLRNENELLRGTNIKIQQMYERLADRIREEETLKLKIRVHDEIGSSLIGLSELLGEGLGEDPDRQLQTLRNAVSYFAGAKPSETGSFEEARQKAADMKVELSLEGQLPSDSTLCEIITAAARECVTNCVRHAGGHKVTVSVSMQGSRHTVTITNDGRKPEGAVREGGGLSGLRRRVEAAGGEMRIEWQPAFALILTLQDDKEEL